MIFHRAFFMDAERPPLVVAQNLAVHAHERIKPGNSRRAQPSLLILIEHVDHNPTRKRGILL